VAEMPDGLSEYLAGLPVVGTSSCQKFVQHCIFDFFTGGRRTIAPQRTANAKKIRLCSEARPCSRNLLLSFTLALPCRPIKPLNTTAVQFISASRPSKNTYSGIQGREATAVAVI